MEKEMTENQKNMITQRDHFARIHCPTMMMMTMTTTHVYTMSSIWATHFHTFQCCFFLVSVDA